MLTSFRHILLLFIVSFVRILSVRDLICVHYLAYILPFYIVGLIVFIYFAKTRGNNSLVFLFWGDNLC